MTRPPDPNPWASLSLTPPFIAEVDRPILDADHQGRYGLRCGVLPHAWIGNPAEARVLLLQLNPGFSDRDVTDEETIPAYRQLARSSLTLQQSAGFWVLDCRLVATGAAGWWRPRLRPLLEALGTDGEALLQRGLAVAEYFPYHSIRYRWPPRLPSQDFTFQLVRGAIQNGAVVVVMRQWEHWRAAVPELIPYEQHKRVFQNPNPRQAAVSRRNLGGDAFDAIVTALFR
jgi:hypothetical protein